MGVPVIGPFTSNNERLEMVDAHEWAVTRDPVYYKLYAGDGSVRLYRASNEFNERGRFLQVTDAHGFVTTTEQMGVDIVYTAAGPRQFLTPSRLADIHLKDEGYEVIIYALTATPIKDETTGLYPVPATDAIEKTLVVRPAERGRLALVDITKNGKTQHSVFEFQNGDWSLHRASGVDEIKVKESHEADGAFTSKTIRDALGNILSYKAQTYGYFDWGYSITNVTEGVGNDRTVTTYDRVAGHVNQGLVSRKVEPSGLTTTYQYDREDRVVREERFLSEGETNVLVRSYAAVDPRDVPARADSRPRCEIEWRGACEIARTYYVYTTLTDLVERAVAPGAAYGAASSRRRMIVRWGAEAGAKAGQTRAVYFEDGKVDLYDYTLSAGVWTTTITHVTAASPTPVSGRTTREVSVVNSRGEKISEKIGGSPFFEA